MEFFFAAGNFFPYKMKIFMPRRIFYGEKVEKNGAELWTYGFYDYLCRQYKLISNKTMSPVSKYTALVRKLRNAEHFGFYGYTVDLVTPHLSSLAEIRSLWDAFYALFQKEDVIFKRSRQSEDTEFIRRAYMKARNEFIIIRRIVGTALYSDDAAEKTAADKLTIVTNNYKHIPSVAMNEAGSLIINMVQDLRLPKYASAVATLALASHVDKLAAYNDEFRELFLARIQEQESLAEQGAMKEIRAQVDESFALFTYTLGGIYLAAQSAGQTARAAALKEIIDGINGIILQYEHIYARRQPGTVSSDRPGGTTPPAPPAPSEPSEPAEPAETALAVAAQTVPLVENDGGTAMEVVFQDVDAFALALYPDAQGATLLVRKEEDGPEGEFTDFPIEDFIMEGEPPNERPIGIKTGLHLGAYNNSYWYESPFQSQGPAEARVEKNDETLAILAGLEYPAIYRN
jgi:hypothetical protein